MPNKKFIYLFLILRLLNTSRSLTLKLKSPLVLIRPIPPTATIFDSNTVNYSNNTNTYTTKLTSSRIDQTCIKLTVIAIRFIFSTFSLRKITTLFDPESVLSWCGFAKKKKKNFDLKKIYT